LNKIHISTLLINMVNKNKILSDLSKFAVDAMSAFSGLREEIETIVSLRVNKVIKKMNLVKKDEFDVLKKMVEKLIIDNEKVNKKPKKSTNSRKKRQKKTSFKKKSIRR
tara:strand:+ start:630 stop:956 length:327 start_codon:yes stop_codon:yes gene_type:complete